MNRWWAANIDSELADIIITLNIKLSGKEVTRDWTNDVAIDYEDLDNALEEMPSILSFWSAVLAESRKTLKLLEVKIDIRRSKILESLKEQMKEGIRLTKDDKDNLVNVDETFVKLRSRHIELEATVSKLFGIVDSLKTKADNIRSMAAIKRAELHNS